MEMVSSNGFSEMTQEEMEMINAGGWKTAAGVFVGTVAVAWSPVAIFAGPQAAAGMALGGLALIGKSTGRY